jgi:hypothetical protein
VIVIQISIENIYDMRRIGHQIFDFSKQAAIAFMKALGATALHQAA